MPITFKPIYPVADASDPIQYTETEWIECSEPVYTNGAWTRGSFVFHGPDNELCEEICDVHGNVVNVIQVNPDYEWHFHEHMNYLRPVTRDVNPDIPLNISLYNSGCDVPGYLWPKEPGDNEPSMIDRTHQDCCKKVLDHNGRYVLAKIEEKYQERITWHYDPAMWHEKLPQVPMDLIVHFTRALRELGWGRTEARQLMYGYYRPETQSWVMALTDPDLPPEMLTLRLQQIIDASNMFNYGDMIQAEKQALRDAGFADEFVSDEFAYYEIDDSTGDITFKEARYVTQYDDDYDLSDYYADNDKTDKASATNIAVNLEDGMDQINDAVTHTIKPFAHPNDSLPYRIWADIRYANWELIKTLQTKLAMKKKYYAWNSQFSKAQKNQIWDLINFRRMELGRAPLSSVIDKYERVNGRWQPKGGQELYTWAIRDGRVYKISQVIRRGVVNGKPVAVPVFVTTDVTVQAKQAKAA